MQQTFDIDIKHINNIININNMQNRSARRSNMKKSTFLFDHMVEN